MHPITVAGPFKLEGEARKTAKALGDNCIVYAKIAKDANGVRKYERDWFVECDEPLPNNLTSEGTTA